MLPTAKLIAKLRELGLHFKEQCPRVCLYAKGKVTAHVPRRDDMAIAHARRILENTGLMSKEDIDSFLASAVH